jgi:anti-sigma factor RsiW
VNAPNDERLMRYFDGEMDEAEAREIEAWLEGSERGRLVVKSFERVGSAVRAIGEDAGGDGIADAVMARLEQERAAGYAAPVNVASRAARPARRRLGAVAPAVGLTLAAAAAIVLFLRARTPSDVRAPHEVVAAASERPFPAAPTASEGALASADLASGAAIESIDFGAFAGTIFMVPSDPADESETPVVWLMDDPTPDEGRMAPL